MIIVYSCNDKVELQVYYNYLRVQVYRRQDVAHIILTNYMYMYASCMCKCTCKESTLLYSALG